MSRDGACEFVWGGDERTFRLGIGELLALQDKLGSGPEEIATRLRDGTWRLQDVQEIFRLGLIGAGEDAKKARALVDENIAPGRIRLSVLPALGIILSALMGDENDPVGKGRAAPATPETAASHHQAYTEAEPS